MTYRQLWQESSKRLQYYPTRLTGLRTFANGARWMHTQLDVLNNSSTPFNEQMNFDFYGWLKYSVCITASLISTLLLYFVHPVLMPLAVLVFYFCEVQLLFLFPLLIDDAEKPILTSIRCTAFIGTWKAMRIIVPVSLRMLVGLLNINSPLRSWYTGCLVVIIWYQYEVRNRIK